MVCFLKNYHVQFIQKNKLSMFCAHCIKPSYNSASIFNFYII